MTITLGDGMYHWCGLRTYTCPWTEYVLLVNKFARGNNGAIYPAELKLESFFFILIELDQLVSVLYSDKCVIESIFYFN